MPRAPPPEVISPSPSSIDHQLQDLQQQVESLSAVDKELAASRKENLELTARLNAQERKLALSPPEELSENNSEKRRSRKPTMKPLPVQSVERSVTTRLSEVLACYNEAISGDDEETIQAKVGIAQNGKVKWVAAPFQGDASASRCLQRALKRLTFPASEVATTAILTLSFFRLDSGLLAVNMRAKTRNAELGQVTIDAKGRILVNCDPMDPLCGIEGDP